MTEFLCKIQIKLKFEAFLEIPFDNWRKGNISQVEDFYLLIILTKY